jgi:sugar phosphate permease
MIAPLLFAAAVVRYGWRSAFYLISIPGFVITLLAYRYLRDRPSEYPGMTAQELAASGVVTRHKKKYIDRPIIRP